MTENRSDGIHADLAILADSQRGTYESDGAYERLRAAAIKALAGGCPHCEAMLDEQDGQR